MSTEPLSSFPLKERVALLDLVETEAVEASRAFVSLAKRHADEVGGRVGLANETLVPMTIPVPESTPADEATRSLVLSEVPTPAACRILLAKRNESISPSPGTAIRTYAARPWSKLQATVAQTIMKGRGLFGRTRVPRLAGDGGAEVLEALVRDSAIHGELPEIGIQDSRWTELVQRGADRPIWMLNFLGFRPSAIYSDPEAQTSEGSSISGARAYGRYGQGMFRSLTRVGGYVAWMSRRVEVLPGTDDEAWDQIAIAYYPSTAAMLTMLGDPEYQAAHVHREAGLARTRLVATQPLAG